MTSNWNQATIYLFERSSVATMIELLRHILQYDKKKNLQ